MSYTRLRPLVARRVTFDYRNGTLLLERLETRRLGEFCTWKVLNGARWVLIGHTSLLLQEQEAVRTSLSMSVRALQGMLDRSA